MWLCACGLATADGSNRFKEFDSVNDAGDVRVRDGVVEVIDHHTISEDWQAHATSYVRMRPANCASALTRGSPVDGEWTSSWPVAYWLTLVWFTAFAVHSSCVRSGKAKRMVSCWVWFDCELHAVRRRAGVG